MLEKFIITLIDHRNLGLIFLPFWASKHPDKEFFTTDQRITLANLESFESQLTDDQIEIVQLIEEYNDNNLLNLFLKKKKMSAQDFLSNVAPELFKDHIRPYIEKRLANCTNILANDGTPIFFKDSQVNVYESDQIILDDEPAEAIFNFVREPEELRYYLTIRHQQKDMKLHNEAKIIVDDPCRLLMDKKLYIFDNINGKKLLPFFNKPFISIPKSSEKKYLSSFVKNSIAKYEVFTEGFEIKHRKPDAKAIISLEKGLDHSPIIVLKFKYNNKDEFYANRSPFIKVSLTEKNDSYTFHKLKRDLVWETLKISELISTGLRNTQEAIFELPQIKEIDKTEEKLEDFIEWIKITVKLLRQKGFEIDQDFFEVKYNLDSVKLKINVNDKKDWFDIKAVVTIGEFKIPFIRFRNNILNGNRVFILPNGEIAILPKEWFSQYKDLFTFSEEEEDILKLKKHHLTIIKKTMEGIDKQRLADLSDTIDVAPPEIPEGVKADLRPYQKDGFNWMYSFSNNNMGICLADDMGLGKTLQTITLLKSVIDKRAESEKALKEVEQGVQLSIFDQVINNGDKVNIKGYVNTSLIVMPASLIYNWNNEINKFAPDLKVHKFIGSKRSDDISTFDQYDVVLTTYGLVRNEIDKFKNYSFLYVILDESQYIKNPRSKIYKAITKLNSDHKIILTGTPIENSLTDLWAQLNFLNTGLLGNLNFFKKEFVYPIEKHKRDDKEKKEAKLKAIISPFILRRTKGEVAKDLPPVSANIMYCDMTEGQKTFYEEEKSKIRNVILENIEKTGKEKAGFLILQGLTKLRQLANHPKLINEDFNEGSGKFDEIIRNVESLVDEKHKVLIFSSFVQNLNLFKKYFEDNNMPYAWLTGESKNREDIINKFQDEEDTRIFLISLKAGGVGLNLTAADYVFITDPWWNPAVEDQAINRAHRIGQDKKVFVYRFISNDTIEEKIVKLQTKKAQLAENFMSDQNLVNNFSVDELLELVN